MEIQNFIVRQILTKYFENNLEIRYDSVKKKLENRK